MIELLASVLVAAASIGWVLEPLWRERRDEGTGERGDEKAAGV